MSNNTRLWLHGLVAAGIGAGANSITTAIAAPEQFNFTSSSGLKHIGVASLIAAVGSVAFYLSKSPVPPTLTITDTEKKTETDSGTTTTKTSSVKVE